MTDKQLALQYISAATHYLENSSPLDAFAAAAHARRLNPELHMVSSLQAVMDEASRAISMDLCVGATLIRAGRIVDAERKDREMIATMEANGYKR